MHPFIQKIELPDSNQCQRQQQYNGQRGGIGLVEEAECNLVDIIEQQRACVVRPALGQDEQVIDELELTESEA